MTKSKWHGKECLNHINNKLRKNMTVAANFVKDEAWRRCPVDTHNLQDSLTFEVAKDGGEIIGIVGTNVKYAIHVEYGSENGKKPKQVGQMPFLRPALLDNKQQVNKLLHK